MDYRFRDGTLEALATGGVDCGFPPGVVKAFRKRIQQIAASLDERDLYALKSLRFEKLKGARAHQRSMRLNDQWRLILEPAEESGRRVLEIVAIEDYH